MQQPSQDHSGELKQESNDQTSSHSKGQPNSQNPPENPPSYSSSQSNLPENQPDQPRYVASESLLFKTTDRILDDIRSDLYFILSADLPILARKPVQYAGKLQNFVSDSASTPKYRLLTVHSSLEYLNIDTTRELPHGRRLTTLHGLIVPRVAVQIPQDPLYHFTIKIKGAPNTAHLKHKFYAYKDEQLSPEDTHDLILDEKAVKEQASHFTGDDKSYLSDVLNKSIPKIVDSVNLYSEGTDTLVRVEIMEPVLSYKEFEGFENTAIQERLQDYLNQISDKVPIDSLHLKVPSTVECLRTLFRVLKGPFDDINSVYRRALKPDNSPALKLLDLEMLMRVFSFRDVSDKKENKGMELQPPHFRDFGIFAPICSEYYVRALQEVLFVSSIFVSDSSAFFNQRFDFDFSLKGVFEAFNEGDMTTQVQNWTKWSLYQYNSGFTTLSACNYYPDSLIIELYNRAVALDRQGASAYFDALMFCATSKGGQELQIYASTLQSQGMVGFEELRSSFERLGFSPKNSDDLLKLDDEKLIDSYKSHLLVSESRDESSGYRKALQKIATYRDSALIRTFLDTEPMDDVAQAYNTLDTSPVVDDDVLITAYQLKMEDSTYYDSAFPRALLGIAMKRKSMMLMSYIDSNMPNMFPRKITVEEAFNIIGADIYASDTAVIRIFQERVNKETSLNFQDSWKALKVIAITRKSKIMEDFLSRGILDSTLLSVDSTPAGLNNIGNTCYLNSLLQYYFVIKPLRELVLKFDKVLSQEVFDDDPKYKIRRIGGRVVGYKETERSYQFMYQLKDLYYRMIHENSRCVTPTRELAYLSFSPIEDPVEFVYDTPADSKQGSTMDLTADTVEEKSMSDEPETEKAEKPAEPEKPNESEESKEQTETEPVEVIDKTEAQEAVDKSEDIVPSAAVAKIGHDQIQSAFEIGRQQDVTECISNVLSQIESALNPDELDESNEQLDFVKTLFYGKTKQTLTPVDPQTKEEKPDEKPRTKIERFLNLIVNIGDHPKDIYDALDTYFTEDLLDLDEEEVKRSLTITQLPNILQVQIQRVQFDRVRLMPVKSTEPLPFGEKLYMDRYMDTDDKELISKRREVFHWRRRINALKERRQALVKTNKFGLNVKESLVSTKEFLESEITNQIGVLVDENTLEVLEQEIKKLDDEYSALNKEIDELEDKITRQFSDFKKIGYSIFAIFIHRGQASYGHYWIYIKDPQTGLFRRYNDEMVSEVPLDEVFNFSETNTATPYYLAFVKDSIAEVVDPLRREIIENLVDEID